MDAVTGKPLNIFVTHPDPYQSSKVLPDKHIVKMPLECCQMLSIVASEKWGHGFGHLPRKDGTPYKTDHGAFRNHPCTIWASEFVNNWQWLISHGLALCSEYEARYNKVHSCLPTLQVAKSIFPHGDPTGRSGKDTTPFVRAMPDEFKLDTSISTFDAYKMYISSKPWVSSNYKRLPSRKPDWV